MNFLSTFICLLTLAELAFSKVSFNEKFSNKFQQILIGQLVHMTSNYYSRLIVKNGKKVQGKKPF